jgi:hypothetical protein
MMLGKPFADKVFIFIFYLVVIEELLPPAAFFLFGVNDVNRFEFAEA